MPITKSAAKALRQSKTKQARNVAKKKKYKSAVKEFKKAVSAKDFDKAKTLLPKVYKSLDKSAKTKVIKKNKADRLKSRMTLMLQKNTA